MVKVLFQPFSTISGHMIKIQYILYKVSEIFISYHMTNKLVKILDKPFEHDKHYTNIIPNFVV